MNAYPLAADCWPAAILLLTLAWKWRNPVTMLGAAIALLLLTPITLTILT